MQRDCSGARDQCRHGCQDAPAAGRRGVGGGPDLQAFGEFGEAADLRWGGRGQVNRVGLFQTAGRPRTLDIATVGRGGRRTEDRRTGQRQHDRADAEKNTSPHLKQQWVIPPDANAAFVAAMEDVLEVYQRPYDRQRPLVCLDETSKQLIAETRVPIAAKPGRPGRHDYEYRRIGTANLFITDVRATGRLAARQGHRPSHGDGLCPGVVRNYPTRTSPVQQKIVLVQDNLNTHKPASLYEAFPLPKPAGSSNGSSGTTHQNTGVGSTWRNLNSAFSLAPMPRPPHPRLAGVEGRSRGMGS